MKIDLLKTNSEKIRVNKAFSMIKSVNGNLNESCSVINPSISFEYDSSLISANYAYIPDFQRYYYIEDMVLDGKLINISMHSDVLMNAASNIRNSFGTIVRSNYDMPDVIDPMVIQTSEHQIQFRSLGTIPTTPEGFYVVNIGGHSNG